MSLSFATVKRFKPQAGIRRGLVDITLDADMPSGGWVVAASDFKLNKLLHLHVPSVDGYTGRFDQVNSTIVYYEAVAGDEIDTNELDTKVIRVEYIGS